MVVRTVHEGAVAATPPSLPHCDASRSHTNERQTDGLVPSRPVLSDLRCHFCKEGDFTIPLKSSKFQKVCQEAPKPFQNPSPTIPKSAALPSAPGMSNPTAFNGCITILPFLSRAGPGEGRRPTQVNITPSWHYVGMFFALGRFFWLLGRFFGTSLTLEMP